MEVIFILVPVALIIVGIMIGALWWAVQSGQFDDLEGPAHRILMDDKEDEIKNTSNTSNKNPDNPTKKKKNQ